MLISPIATVITAATRRDEGQALLYPRKPLTLMVAIAANGIVRRAAISRIDVALRATTSLSSRLVSSGRSCPLLAKVGTIEQVC